MTPRSKLRQERATLSFKGGGGRSKITPSPPCCFRTAWTEDAITPYTLQAIHACVGGALSGNGAERITGVNALDRAQPGELAFAEHRRLAPQVRRSRASAILVPSDFPALPEKNLLRVVQPRLALLTVMKLFQIPAPALRGIHPTAVIAPQATLGPAVAVGECAIVRAGAVIGANTVIESGAHVGSGVTVGEQCWIGPHVVLSAGTRVGRRVIIKAGAVIGGSGFGYLWTDHHYVKMPELGHVVIEDDVDIGANVCVDRAMFGSTIIRRGTKIDNLVQIAHNTVIGEDVIITGQVGLSGSVRVGNRVIFGGQSGVTDHVTIGDDARIGAGTPVIRDVTAGETVWGFPAHRGSDAKREIASVTHLPTLLHQFRELLIRFARIESSVQSLEQMTRETQRQDPP